MIKKTKFKNLIILKNITHYDKRGYFKELLKEKNLKSKFPYTVMSYSKKMSLEECIYKLKTPRVNLFLY